MKVTPILVSSGIGQAKAKADIAYVSIGVVTESESASEANTNNATLTQKLRDALEKAGIKKEEVETTYFNINEVTKNKKTGFEDEPENESDRIKFWVVTHNLNVKTRDAKNVGSLVDLIAPLGNYKVHDISFDTSERTKHEEEALRRAVKDARRKAEIAASEENKVIKDIQNISIGHSYGGSPKAMRGMVSLQAAGAPTEITPGELSIPASVTVEYTLGGVREKRTLKRREFIKRENQK